jgi:hypothetical protein
VPLAVLSPLLAVPVLRTVLEVLVLALADVSPPPAPPAASTEPVLA